MYIVHGQVLGHNVRVHGQVLGHNVRVYGQVLSYNVCVHGQVLGYIVRGQWTCTYTGLQSTPRSSENYY